MAARTTSDLKNVETFIAETGWVLHHANPAAVKGRMTVALRWFHEVVGRTHLLQPMRSPGPFVPKPPGGGSPIMLVQYMQAIDFGFDVKPRWATPVDRFKSFRPRNEKPAKRPPGNYYTFLSQRAGKLGLPANQNVPHLYRPTRQVRFLQSKISDAFTWLPPEPGGVVDAKARRDFAQDYYRGGGSQCFIWNGRDHLVLE